MKQKIFAVRCVHYDQMYERKSVNFQDPLALQISSLDIQPT